MIDANIHMYRAETSDLRLEVASYVYTSVKDVIERDDDDDVEKRKGKIRIHPFPFFFNTNKHLSTRAHSLILFHQLN